MPVTHRTAAAIALLATLITSTAHAGSRDVPADQRTALDDYIAAPDPSYRYEVAKTAERDGLHFAALDLTSQTWLTKREVDRPVWRHWLVVVRPKEVRTDIALLFIGGGANDRDAPSQPDGRLADIAKATGSVVAELKTVPNQPLVFTGDGTERVEDDIIAYTWDRYLQTKDAKWPARLPMTKSAVRAMDAVTDFCASEAGGGVKVGRFVVAGASKRGWTTWTTAAVDDRVVGIIPIVIDTLNIPASAAHHKAAYGFYAPSLRAYEEMGLDRWVQTPENAELMRIEDPYAYRARFTMPKLMLNATGDQFFLPDNSRFYFNDLPGPKYLRYVPNADHSLDDTDAGDTFLAFYRHLLTGDPLPTLTWRLSDDGTVFVESSERPQSWKLWQATNPAARDFRLETIGTAWTSTDLAAAAAAADDDDDDDGRSRARRAATGRRRRAGTDGGDPGPAPRAPASHPLIRGQSGSTSSSTASSSAGRGRGRGAGTRRKRRTAAMASTPPAIASHGSAR